MSDLNGIEKLRLEKLFGMEGGYLLDFSHRSLQEFVWEAVSIDISGEKYNYMSGSKANRMRAFWKEESNYLVGKLLEQLIEFWRTSRGISGIEITEADERLYEECQKISKRLKLGGQVENIDALKPNSEDRDFAALAKSVRESIERNEPALGLDRLHTFVVKYSRVLCDKHSIPYDKNVPLHALFGSYVKHLRDTNVVESEMTMRILGSSIKLLETFNDIRNNKSFAHDNKILNYDESMLIFSNVSNVIKFLESIEKDREKKKDAQVYVEEIRVEDLPF